MRRIQTCARVIAFVALGLISACGADDGDGGPALAYGLGGRPSLPFPTNEAAVPDGDAATGLRLAIGERGTNLGDVDESIFLFGESFTEELSRLDGWSTLGPTFIPLGRPADEASLADGLALVDLERGVVVPTTLSTIGGETDYMKPVHWAVLRPLGPLAENTRHAIVATRGLRTADGEAFTRPTDFDRVWNGDSATEGDPMRISRAVDRLAGVPEELARAGIAADDVLVADVYTTLSIHAHAERLIAAMKKHVATITVTSTASSQHAGIRTVARAMFDLPTYRANVDGPIELVSEDDEPTGYEETEILIVVPEGEGPFPVVMFHHGLGGEKEKLLEFAPDIVPLGIVMVAIDAPLHGARTDRPGNAGTRFLNVVAPQIVADNLRQAEADQVYFTSVIRQLADVDITRTGDAVVDPNRLFYLGESLGSIVGAAVVGLAPQVEGAVLMVGGGTLLEFFDRVLSGFEFDGFPTRLFTSVAQTVLDRGDPTNFVEDSRDKQIFLMQAMEDVVVPPAATQSLGRAMGLPIVAPVEFAPEGVETTSGPTLRRGWTQFPGVGHNLFYESERPTYAAARGQLFHFLDTWAKTGTGEIRTDATP